MINYPTKKPKWKPRDSIAPKKQSKYNNVISEFDGLTFHSNKEKRTYILLNQLKQSGRIKDFELQVGYELQEAYKNALGKKIRPIKYYADFVIIGNDLEEHIIDVKSDGTITQLFRVKKKMFEYKYNKILHCVKDNGELLKILKI